ncbi:MAG: hypothetical protein ACFBZ9_08135 [Sphingomonadales bacterium]
MSETFAIPPARLKQILDRHQELQNLLASPDGIESQEFVKLSREFAELDTIAEAASELQDAQ